MTDTPPLGRIIPKTPFDKDIEQGQARRVVLKRELREIEEALRSLHRSRIDHQQGTLFDENGKIKVPA